MPSRASSPSGDASLAASAEATFAAFHSDEMRGAVLSKGVRSEQLDAIARRTQEASVLEPLIRHKSVPERDARVARGTRGRSACRTSS